MQKQELKKYEGQTVRLVLKKDWKFTGKLLKVNDTSIDFMDYMGNRLTIDSNDISFIYQEGEL